jgi:hypothetical protein
MSRKVTRSDEVPEGLKKKILLSDMKNYSFVCTEFDVNCCSFAN